MNELILKKKKIDKNVFHKQVFMIRNLYESYVVKHFTSDELIISLFSLISLIIYQMILNF